MTVQFFDSYESGNTSAWSATQLSGAGETLAVDGGSAKSGAYGLHTVYNEAGDSSGKANAYKKFDSSILGQTVIYLEFWFQFQAYTSAGYNLSTSKGIANIRNDISSGTNTSNCGRAFHLSLSGAAQVQGFYQETVAGTDTAVTGTFTFTVGTWYQIRMMVDRTNPASIVMTWWTSTDGLTFTQRGTATDTGNAVQGVGASLNCVDVGIVHCNQFEKGNYVCYHDYVSVSDAPYSPLAGGILPSYKNYPRNFLRPLVIQ